MIHKGKSYVWLTRTLTQLFNYSTLMLINLSISIIYIYYIEKQNSIIHQVMSKTCHKLNCSTPNFGIRSCKDVNKTLLLLKLIKYIFVLNINGAFNINIRAIIWFSIYLISLDIKNITWKNLSFAWVGKMWIVGEPLSVLKIFVGILRIIY